MPKRFWDRPDHERFAIYEALEQVGCDTHPSGSAGKLNVAVAKGAFAKLCGSLMPFGLKCDNLWEFPLGTDTPDDRFRHAGNWLIATFS